MRFVTFLLEEKERVGVMNEDCSMVIDLSPIASSTLLQCIKQGEAFIKEVEAFLQNKNGAMFSLDEVTLLAPIPRPQKNIFCVGKNYALHAIEMGSEDDIPKYPLIFSKAPTTVIGPNMEVDSHQDVTNELDYEGEIALIIGKDGKNIKKEEAFDYIFGYTLLNDITARDLQRAHQQYLLGKSLDTTCPLGPWITYKSLVNRPHDLQLETRVNGELRQSANTSQFIFDIPTIIETLSKGMTLEAGDIIATGTPAGVGSGFQPPKHLKPGDEIEITVKELGVLRNKIMMM